MILVILFLYELVFNKIFIPSDIFLLHCMLYQKTGRPLIEIKIVSVSHIKLLVDYYFINTIQSKNFLWKATALGAHEIKYISRP